MGAIGCNTSDGGYARVVEVVEIDWTNCFEVSIADESVSKKQALVDIGGIVEVAEE
jgi:hypothetical protein